MAGELSKILEHVETMNELDLEGVEPTRTWWTSRTCCARTCRDRACRARWRSSRRPDADRGRLPGAEPGRVVSDELLGLTAARAGRARSRPAR